MNCIPGLKARTNTGILSECSQRRYVPLLSKHVRLQTINKTPCPSDKNGEAFGCVINLRHG